MASITIPRKLTKTGELVVTPRKEYEDLVRLQKKHKRFYHELDKDLTKAVKDYNDGVYHGPFTTVAEGKRFMSREKSSPKK